MPKQHKLKYHVECGKLPGRFSKDANGNYMKWPHKDGYTRVNVCSSARNNYKNLSPMILGPYTYYCTEVEIKEGKQEPTIQVYNLENLWQFSKIWSTSEMDLSYFKKHGIEFDAKNDEHLSHVKPSALFYKNRLKGWKDKKAHRFAPQAKLITNGNRHVPLCSWWRGKCYRYIESRKSVYCPIYEQLARKTSAWKELQALSEKGNVLVIGFDGYEVGDKSLSDCMENGRRPFGHELVLVSMLRGERYWKTLDKFGDPIDEKHNEDSSSDSDSDSESSDSDDDNVNNDIGSSENDDENESDSVDNEQ